MGIDSKYESRLKAKLSFKEDVAPKDYSGVRKRLEVPEGLHHYSTNLGEYLKRVENIEYSKNYMNDKVLGRHRKVSLKPNKRKMTLDVCVTSENSLEQNELLNVKNLYRFIATGNYPLKGREKLKQAHEELVERENTKR